MKKIVADSTALILLSKCSLLKIVCTRFEVIAPKSVIDETASIELSKKYPDAATIRDLYTKKLIKLKKSDTKKYRTPLKLHKGEEDALKLALKTQGAIYATDDGKAIKAAKFMGIPFIITPKIVVDLYNLKEVSLVKARQSIEKLGKIGRYSPEIIAEAFLTLSEIKNGKTHNNKNTGRSSERD